METLGFKEELRNFAESQKPFSVICKHKLKLMACPLVGSPVRFV